MQPIHVSLIENFRAVFYSPFYAAIVLGAYDGEGLEVDLQKSPDPEKTLQQLSSGSGQVSWGGPLRILLAHDKDAKSEAVAFCEVARRDPFLLLGRTPNPGYRPQHLLGKKVAIVSEVPTPWICLQQDLRLAGVDPAQITLAPARSMDENAAALRAGEVDVIQSFHPYAQAVIDSGEGHLWCAAASRGLTSYTTLNTTRGFIERNPDTILRMTRAMYRTLKWVAAHDGADLARAVASYFPDVPLPLLSACCAHYKALEVWSHEPVQTREGFERLRDSMQASGVIGRQIAHEECADMRFAQQAAQQGVPSL
jgi:NitT/TauT family transport system substrate-binding protein